jgi:pimeloyl-ACP methyl ester carboxylesterase
MRRPLAVLVAAMTAATVLSLPGPAYSSPQHSAEDQTVTNEKDGTKIAITVFRPAAAAGRDVPVVLHSHGWGGSRETSISATVKPFLDAGLGVVSIDQRGHGDSEGKANMQDPTKETEDIEAVIDRVASYDWVLRERRDGRVLKKDPVLGSIGISYGGGYQTMLTLDEIAETGRTRLDALAPEITWFDLPESLAPENVPRSAWDTLLYAVGARMLPQYVHEGYAWGAATGQWPDGTLYGEEVPGAVDIESELRTHGPSWFVKKGVRIDVPVLVRQGSTDNLFNLNQGLKIFEKAVTPKARKNSYFVAFNGGHALPNIYPAGSTTALELGGGHDACSGDFAKLTVRFFKRVFAGRSTKGLLPTRYNLTTADGDDCLRLDSLRRRKSFEVNQAGTGGVVVPTVASPPIHVEVARGPVTVNGIPRLSGRVTSAALDGRAFIGLAVGTSPADARVVQNNLMPLRRPQPVQDDKFTIELAGVAVEVPKGKNLYLTVSSFSDMYFGHGSRAPGAMVLDDLRLSLPVSKS